MPGFKGVIEASKSPPACMDAPAFREFLTRDAARMGAVVLKIGKVE